MCYYCQYLAKEKSTDLIDDHANLTYQTSRSFHIPTLLRLIALTCFFLILNLTIVLSHSSQIQQQKDQSSSKILERNSQGKIKSNFRVFILNKIDIFLASPSLGHI